MRIRSKKGFTLIELIIVVAIIGILAAIAIPKFGNVQKDAKEKADLASAKNIANAIQIAYTQDDVDNLNINGKLYGITASIPNLQTTPVVKGTYNGDDGKTALSSAKFMYTLDSNGSIKIYICDISVTSGSDVGSATTRLVYPR